MIPRLHPRGTSFKEACRYILHDVAQDSADRVAWVATRNLSTQDPKWAWHEMYETWAAQNQLKATSGHDARGRKNTRPVLHYTLSWATGDQPTPEEMKEAAVASLKVMRLADHEALITAHKDKEHQHVHIVVNTVHPETGMTAPMKFSKLELSKWAEGYEILNGLHREARVANNAERRRHASERSRAASDQLMAAGPMRDASPEAPYVPVKHRADSRKQWFDRTEVIDRMKAMRAGLDAELKTARDVTWQRQSRERDALDVKSETAVDQARQYVKDRFRPRWRDLYSAQKKEAKHVARVSGNLLERAVYVYANRERLGGGRPLTARQMLAMIRSPARLQQRVGQIHEQDRRQLARQSKTATNELTDVMWQRHRLEFTALRDRQTAERHAERDAQATQRKDVSFGAAKATLAAERENTARPIYRAPEPGPARQPKEAPSVAQAFTKAAESAPGSARQAKEAPSVAQPFTKAADPAPAAPVSRAEQIKRDMDEWKKRNPDRDHGREL